MVYIWGLAIGILFVVGKVGETESTVMIVFSNKQHNTYIINIYFVQTRGTQNS